MKKYILSRIPKRERVGGLLSLLSMNKNIANVRLFKALSKEEQSGIIGGHRNGAYCDEQTPCFKAGDCCINYFCTPAIDKQGNYLLCDF